MIEKKNVEFIRGTYDEVLSYFRNDLKVLSTEDFSKLDSVAQTAIGLRRELTGGENTSIEDQLKSVLNNKPPFGRIFILETIDYIPFPGNLYTELQFPKASFRLTGYYVDIKSSSNVFDQAIKEN